MLFPCYSGFHSYDYGKVVVMFSTRPSLNLYIINTPYAVYIVYESCFFLYILYTYYLHVICTSCTSYASVINICNICIIYEYNLVICIIKYHIRMIWSKHPICHIIRSYISVAWWLILRVYYNREVTNCTLHNIIFIYEFL